MEAAFKIARANRGHAAAVNDVRLYRILFDHAVRKKWRPDNPAKQIEIAHPKARTRLWTPDEFDAFCEAATANNRGSIALAALLALELAQRVSDVLSLRWNNLKDGVFTIRQQKTGNVVRPPLSARLRKALKAVSRDSTHIVVCESTGRPWTKDYFKHEFTRIRRLAKIPDEDAPTFHDLRRTGLTDLGDTGSTDDELRSVGGLSRDTASIYVQPTGTMAANAVAKRDAARAKQARSGKSRRRS